MKIHYLLVLCFVPALASAASLEVEGIDGELRDNVLAYFGSGPGEHTEEVGLQEAAAEAVRNGLKPLGFYEPKITFLTSSDAKSQVRVRVDKGVPVVLSQVKVRIWGEGKDDPVLQRTVARYTPRIGSPVNHGQFDRLKEALVQAALDRGYFDNYFKKAQLGISLSNHASVWTIVFETGRRWRFGATTFPNSSIDPEYLKNLVPYQKGDYYEAQQLAELNTRLSEVGWFQSAAATPQFAQATDDKQVPIVGETTPRRKNRMSLGLQYATDSGPGGKILWQKPWFNRRGHSMSALLSGDRNEQKAVFSYKVPVKKSPLEQYYVIESGYQRTDQHDTKSDAATAGVSRYWDNVNGWQKSFSLRWSLTHYTQADFSNTAKLFYPGASISRVRQRGATMPMWGDSQNYSLQVSSRAWASSADFVIFRASDSLIRSWGFKHRFLLRGTLGWMQTSNLKEVPPELRFFAGGDRSIRGYGYESVSPRDSQGKLTGASKLLTGSFEYQYRVQGNWWGAAFIDMGQAVNSWQDSDWKKGAGVGIRWQSPFGPVRFDMAFPVADKNEHGLHLYVGLGAEL